MAAGAFLHGKHSAGAFANAGSHEKKKLPVSTCTAADRIRSDRVGYENPVVASAQTIPLRKGWPRNERRQHTCWMGAASIPATPRRIVGRH